MVLTQGKFIKLLALFLLLMNMFHPLKNLLAKCSLLRRHNSMLLCHPSVDQLQGRTIGTADPVGSMDFDFFISNNTPLPVVSPSPAPKTGMFLITTLDSLRHSTRTRKPSSYLQHYSCNFVPTTSPSTPYPLSNFLFYHRLSPTHSALVYNITSHTKPRTYKEAVVVLTWQ